MVWRAMFDTNFGLVICIYESGYLYFFDEESDHGPESTISVPTDLDFLNLPVAFRFICEHLVGIQPKVEVSSVVCEVLLGESDLPE